VEIAQLTANFADLSDVFTACPHAQKMLAAILVVHSDVTSSFECSGLNALWSGEGQRFIGQLPVSATAMYDIISRGGGCPADVQRIADEAFSLRRKAEFNVSNVPENSLRAMALSSPLLGADMAKSFYVNRAHLPPPFQGALFANPHLVEHVNDVAERPLEFVVGLAAFGDLSLPEVCRHLSSVLGTADASKEIDAGLAIHYLLRRKKLPTNIVFDIDQSQWLNEHKYRTLVSRPEHQTEVNAGRMPGGREFNKRDLEIIASPTPVGEQYLINMFEAGLAAGLPQTERDKRQAAIVANSACPKDIFDNALRNRNCHLGGAQVRHSKWASLVLDAAAAGEFPASEISYDLPGMIPDAKPAHLYWNTLRNPAIPLSSFLRSVTHQNFSWKHVLSDRRIDALRSVSRARSTTSAICVTLAVREPRLAMQHLTKLELPEEGFALLFCEQTSARTLDKIARTHPNLAALAACHPNAQDIPGVPDDAQSLVKQFNQQNSVVVLSGKGSCSPSPVPAALSL